MQLVVPPQEAEATLGPPHPTPVLHVGWVFHVGWVPHVGWVLHRLAPGHAFFTPALLDAMFFAIWIFNVSQHAMKLHILQ